MKYIKLVTRISTLFIIIFLSGCTELKEPVNTTNSDGSDSRFLESPSGTLVVGAEESTPMELVAGVNYSHVKTEVYTESDKYFSIKNSARTSCTLNVTNEEIHKIETGFETIYETEEGYFLFANQYAVLGYVDSAHVIEETQYIGEYKGDYSFELNSTDSFFDMGIKLNFGSWAVVGSFIDFNIVCGEQASNLLELDVLKVDTLKVDATNIYKFDVVSGIKYSFILENSSTQSGDEVIITLLDSSLNALSESISADSNSINQLQFTAEETKTIYVKISESNNAYSVDYTVKVSDVILLEKIIAADGEDRLGAKVDVSGDYIIASNSMSDATVYVYKKEINGSITEIDKLESNSSTALTDYGKSIDIDGDYIVVGAMNEGYGTVYLYKNSGTDNFVLIEKLVADDLTTSSYFGKAVAIDGDYIAVGDKYAAYIFQKDINGSSTQVAKLTASDGNSSEYFGSSVSIDGNYTVVGDSYQQKVYLFKNDGNSTFSEIATMSASDYTNLAFGKSVSIKDNIVAISAEGYNSSAGAVYIYSISADDNVTEIQRLEAIGKSSFSFFGSSISLSNSNLIVGVFKNNVVDGAAYLYSKNANNEFEQTDYFVEESDIYLGTSVAIDANTFAIGATGVDNNGYTDVGAIYYGVIE